MGLLCSETKTNIFIAQQCPENILSVEAETTLVEAENVVFLTLFPEGGRRS